ncbi:DUF1036 domain-containing protein [Phaeobacter gallaeciensis]|uniref:Integral membrane protein n=1 Tax=Phaeobacter gallaeciensis TaxID=60890 RepID=A0AAC9Z829_9RHOB|nr:DUF1036 domain-containing protein [Phaeobacter gallaeciensis]AHD08999.1 putative integral membrane protein [Phaeobacter gallaeciensis DSM 26640]ATE92265.1 putative integral membrane protein [Phaeobacter gallaeciensis]ATE97916.1 putative integral membrane protein [Phaeobacter gallaeciensis]ATF00927.1 putative integral membrane protein [Phaeobacter gallaeciensis]ATF05307.1 putative integral membrane protein [Phaeobacter gallaeciensis]
MRARLILAFLLAPLGLALPAQAGAAGADGPDSSGYTGLEICNDTAVPQSVSLAYRDDGRWMSHGWWALPPETCERVLDGSLKNRFYYFRSEAQNWQFLDERISFCTAPGDFTIYGDRDCAIRGYGSAFFAKIDTNIIADPSGSAQPSAAYVAQISRHSRPKTGGTGPISSAIPGEGATADTIFDQNVTFQGCEERGDGRVICKLVMGAGQLCVTNDGMTDPAIIDRLQALDPGTPVRVSGESLASGDRVTFASLNSLTERAETRHDLMLDDLAGRWVSQADAYDLFIIEGASRHNFYGSVETMTELLSVQTACDDALGVGPYLVAQAEDGGPTHCYRIISLTENELVLSYMPRGTELRYQRQDLPLN